MGLAEVSLSCILVIADTWVWGVVALSLLRG
jgi:hypothetical protein